MKKNFLTSVLMTIATTILLGIIYPLVVTALAQIIFPRQANGDFIKKDGTIIGSSLIGQNFSGAEYFHARPSATTIPYGAASSAGSNLGPTNQKLVDRVEKDVAKLHAQNPDEPVPIDLVTTSASGVDPDITPAAAAFQVPRVARQRGISVEQLRALVAKHTEGRQFGFLGEPRVNVLELNLDLDQRYPANQQAQAN